MELQKINRYTRAGKYGKNIICPECDNLSVVYHFAWGTLKCNHCERDVEKSDWLIQPKTKSSPTQCKLCGRHTIYKTKIEHPYYREPGKCYWCGFVQDEWALIEALTEPVTLQCPWCIPFKGRCQHKTVFTPEQLTNKYMYSCYGSTPYHYPDMNQTCPTCGHCTSAKDFVLNNLDVFRGNPSCPSNKHLQGTPQVRLFDTSPDGS